MSPNRSIRTLLLVSQSALLAGCSPTYVLRAGWEEAKILASRRPIPAVIRDTTTPAEVRHKLRIVQDARDFAQRSLGLDPGNTFTSYVQLERDTLLLVVSAAPEFALTWKTWWFPVVGRVPYRGYFDFARAHREEEKLAASGYDTWIRPTSAFSTLGWLPDPVLSTTLRADSVGLVETVIHETTHTTFFAKGEARFNESLASFVGGRGAIEFFCEALVDDAGCQQARDRWHDTRVFGRFFHSMLGPLQELYAESIPADSMRSRKKDILARAAVRFREEIRPQLRSGRYGDLDPARLNNAWLLSRILYYTRLDDFEAVYHRQGGLRPAVEALFAAARREDPWDALDALVGDPRPRAAEPGPR